jgi:ubiquinone biosynthesis protein COQ9
MQHAFGDGALASLKIRERNPRAAAVPPRRDRRDRRKRCAARWRSRRCRRILARTLQIGWHSADLMWRLAGDTATDYNHYTKRAILMGIYSATLAVFVEDQSEGKAETRAFLDRRHRRRDEVREAKAQLLQKREGFDVARFLGRLRYPAR